MILATLNTIETTTAEDNISDILAEAEYIINNADQFLAVEELALS